MKRGMSYRRCLCLVVVFLQIIVSGYLEVTLYRDVVTDLREAMETTNQVERNMLASGIDEGMRDIYLSCAYLQQSDRLIDYIEICQDEGTLMSERADAFEQIQSIMQRVLGNGVLRGIVIVTPERTYSARQGAADPFHVKLDKRCGREITFSCPEKNYKGCGRSVEINLSALPFYSFQMKEREEIEIYLVLEDTFLDTFLGGSKEVWIYTAEEKLLYGEASMETKAQEMVTTQIASNEWYMVQAQSKHAYWRELLKIILLGLMTFAVTVLLAVLLSGILAGNLEASFQKIITQIRQYKNMKEPRRSGMVQCNGREEGIPVQNLLSLRDRVCLFLMVSVLVPTSLFCVLFHVGIGRVVERQTINSYRAMAESAASSIAGELQKKEDVVLRIIYDSEVIELFRKKERENLVEELEHVIRDNVFYGLYDAMLDVYRMDGRLIYSNNMIAQDVADFAQYQTQSGWEHGEDVLGRMRFTYTSHIRQKRYADILACVRVSLDSDRILNQLYGLSAGRAQFFMAKPDSLAENYMGEDIILCAPVGDTAFNVYARIQKQGFAYYQSFILRKHGISLMVLVIIILMLSWFLAFILLNPLRLVREAMRKVEPGNPDVRLRGYFIDEIDEISRSFNEMADRIDMLVDDLLLSNNRKAQMENEKKRAEIIALQMQINPHFLSNTIETISDIVMDGGKQKACGMLRSMNNLFRYGISKPEVTILVREELQYARAYTEIMRVRYPFIKFLWNIDERILEYTTIKLILQPVIENAIYHGIRPIQKEGTIEINGVLQETAVCFTVCDDGAGIAEKELYYLREKLQDAKLGELIGMFNVQARIRLHYGPDYGIAIESQKGKGTAVRICVPLGKEKEKE